MYIFYYLSRPEGTPYSGGVFEFDIFFPNKYPSVPPKVSGFTSKKKKFSTYNLIQPKSHCVPDVF